jgi:hypothetical protein
MAVGVHLPFRWKKVLHWFLLGGFELADMQAEMYKSAFLLKKGSGARDFDSVR